MSTTTDPDSEPLRVPLSDQLGLEPERAAFETWKRKQGGHYMIRNNAPGSDLSGYQDAHTQGQWEAWQAAVAAERERWQRQCAGKRHDGCTYLATCGSVCNKCGQVA